MSEEYNFDFENGSNNDHWLMVDIQTSKSGLPMVIFALPYTSVLDDDLGPRIRVATHHGSIVDTSELVPVTFYFNEPRDIHQILDYSDFIKIKKFIDLNLIVLWRFWLDKINSDEMLKQIKKIE